MPEGASEALLPTPGARPPAPGDPVAIPVGVGRRVVVVANFGLGPVATDATTWAASGFARALDTWEGPGLVVVAGNLFDLGAGNEGAARVEAALTAHPRLATALES